MRAVINETLRLFPPVPLNSRETRGAPCVLPASDCTNQRVTPDRQPPLYMPAKTTIVFLPLLTQRSPALWGDDADDFDPDRWIDERVGRYVANPAIFTPFNAGPRLVGVQRFFIYPSNRTNLTATVHRSKLRVQRDVVFPRALVTAIRSIHARARIPA